MGSRKKTNNKKIIAPALAYYNLLSINDKINFKSYWHWYGRMRVGLFEIKRGTLNVYGSGVEGVESIKIPY